MEPTHRRRAAARRPDTLHLIAATGLMAPALLELREQQAAPARRCTAEGSPSHEHSALAAVLAWVRRRRVSLLRADVCSWIHISLMRCNHSNR